ncbi:MAG: DUF6678 family protein [Verrucomicrobiota bacterium]
MADTQHPRANAEPVYPSRPFVSEIPKLQRIIADRGLTGLANDAKWNELLAFMRNVPREGWCPGYRYRCIDSDFVSEWDCEWWHHLPFPFISVMWLDLNFKQEVHRGQLLSPQLIDHSRELEVLLTRVGFDFEKGADTIRIFGYAPRDRGDFTPAKKAEQDGADQPATAAKSKAK